MLAIGRTANTRNLNLKKVGVQTHESNLKVLGGFGGEFEKTSVNNIYAVGDCLDKVPELTPIAQQSANLLAHRIFLKTVLIILNNPLIHLIERKRKYSRI